MVAKVRLCGEEVTSHLDDVLFEKLVGLFLNLDFKRGRQLFNSVALVLQLFVKGHHLDHEFRDLCIFTFQFLFQRLYLLLRFLFFNITFSVTILLLRNLASQDNVLIECTLVLALKRVKLTLRLFVLVE